MSAATVAVGLHQSAGTARSAWPVSRAHDGFGTFHRDRSGEAGPVRTHCPYCAFQCGLLVTPSPDGTLSIAGDPDFPVNAGALCLKGFTAGETLAHPDRLVAPLVRNAAGQLVPADWDAGDRHGSPSGIRVAAAQVRTRRDRRVRRRLAHQREGLSARQVRARRPAHVRTSTTTAASACRRPRRPAFARSGSIAACRFRSRTSPGPTPSCSSAPTSPRRCRRSCSTSRRSGAPEDS